LCSPADPRRSKDRCEGRLAEKSHEPWTIPLKLSFKLLRSLTKFMTSQLAGAYSRALHGGGQTAPVSKDCAVILWPNQMWSKPCLIQDTPKSVAGAREMVSRLRRALRGIDPTKHDVEVLPE
jgi:hypothetical protein